MPRRKVFRSGDGDEGEWIMSYADTVTLLLCFFVIFFSESKYGQDSDEQQVAEFESKVENVEVVDQTKDLNKLKIELEARLNKQNLKDFKVIQTDKDISIRLNEKGFFNLGSFKVLPKGNEALSKVSKSLQNMGEDFLIHIEGHTDSKPVRASSFYSSNLGLSSLRASNAAEVLVSLGLKPTHIRAIGFGDAKPVSVDRVIASTGEVSYFEDRTQQNRRIEIRLLPQQNL